MQERTTTLRYPYIACRITCPFHWFRPLSGTRQSVRQRQTRSRISLVANSTWISKFAVTLKCVTVTYVSLGQFPPDSASLCERQVLYIKSVVHKLPTVVAEYQVCSFAVLRTWSHVTETWYMSAYNSPSSVIKPYFRRGWLPFRRSLDQTLLAVIRKVFCIYRW